MALFEKFMNDSLSVAGDAPYENDSTPVAPQRTHYPPSVMEDIGEDFAHPRLDDDFHSSSDSYEFHYGAEKPLIKPANTRVTIKTLATNLSSATKTQVRETDISVFCDGKQVADNTFTPGNRYFVFFQSQPDPSAPEIEERRFIVKTDIDKLRLSDCPLPLITAARVCQFLGNSDIDYTVAPEGKDGKSIFGKSLPASLQQIALKLSAAFVGFETSETAVPLSSKDLYTVVYNLVILTRQAEEELVDVLQNVLAGLNSERNPKFELIKTATAAQIKHIHRKNVPARDIVRDISHLSKIDSWKLIDRPGDVTTTRVKAYQPFDSVVLPLLRHAKNLIVDFSDDALIQLLDVLIDIVYNVNVSFEKYLCLYHKVCSTKSENTSPSDVFPSATEKYKTVYSLFRAVAPYGFINEPVTYSDLQKTLEQAQLHYTIFFSKILN